MSGFGNILEMAIVSSVVGIVIGIIWPKRWRFMALLALFVGPIVLFLRGDWSDFYGPWNETHFIYLFVYLILSLVFFGGASALSAWISRSVKRRILGGGIRP